MKRSDISLQTFEYLIQTQGWVLFADVLEPTFVTRLKADLRLACEECREWQIRNGIADRTSGTAHHLAGRGNSLDELLWRRDLAPYIEWFFGGKYILNSFGGVINSPDDETYLHNIHRDVRTFTAPFRLMLNMLVMLDDFTVENGATYVLPGSHHSPDRPPTNDVFYRHAKQLLGKAGSIVLWDSNLWHVAGRNRSDKDRMALTPIFSRPFVKQGIDYPRFLDEEYAKQLTEEQRQLLGFNARVPTNYDEWYQPPARRPYHADQESASPMARSTPV